MANTRLTSFRGYVFASFLLATAVIGHAGYMKRSFYRAVTFLYNSKLAILSVGNMAFVSILLIWRLIQAIFLGPLRFREVERLHYRARDAVIECCFAMSIFRNEFDLKFVALVMTLLLLKSLHWLAKDRIEFLEEQPVSTLRTHLRLVALMILLFLIDSVFIKKCATITISSSSPTMYVLFAVEFTISIIELVCDMGRYCFVVIDNAMEGHWEGKAMCSFYIELLSDLCQLTVYLFFYIYVQYHYSFPFHIVREVYVTFTRFQKRCTDFWRFRRVVATMNDLFADATEEELAAGDRTCIICREEMETAKKLECGHLFHARCLQNWLKRQQSCPTCRAAIDITGTRATPQNTQQPDGRVNNPAQPDQRNVNVNANNGNAREQANNGQGANVGDAGHRFLNLANQWWNQVLIDAAAARGAAARGRGGGARAAQPGAAAHAGGNNAGNPGANPNGVNEQRDGTGRRVPAANNFTNGNPNPLLRGPNAAAHLQLRARRRVAWPYPYQPYQMQPYLHHRQQPVFQTPTPSNTVNQSSRVPGISNNPVPMPQNPGVPYQQPGGLPERTQGTQVAGSAGNELNAMAPAPLVGAEQPGQSAGSPSASGQPSESPPAPAAVRGSRDREGREPEPPAQAPTAASSGIPLDKLLSIQERIEVLRNEVMELVLLATSAPTTREPEGRNDETRSESATQSAETSTDPEIEGDRDGVKTAEEEPQALPDNPGRAGGEEAENGDPEAVMLRRRRNEFLNRVAGS